MSKPASSACADLVGLPAEKLGKRERHLQGWLIISYCLRFRYLGVGK